MLVIFVWFSLWHSLFSILDWPLRRWSRFYRYLAKDDQRFLRAYITRSIWAIQTVVTSLMIQGILPSTLFEDDIRDVVDGWSPINDFLFPMTLGFALLENYLEFRHHLWPALKVRLGLSSQTVSYQPSLIIHHIVFGLVAAYTYQTKSMAYYDNLLGLWEGTAPISFMVWLAQKRLKWYDEHFKRTEKQKLASTEFAPEMFSAESSDGEDSSSINSQFILSDDGINSSDTHQATSNSTLKPSDSRILSCPVLMRRPERPRLTSEKDVYRLTIIRICIWILFRVVLDVMFVKSLYLNGLLPFGAQSHRLRLGNKLQIWFAASLFVFGLNPYWLYKMVTGWYKRFHSKSRRKTTKTQ